jgi:transcriptional regulator with GAF, ATPase, and Fis domain
MLPWCHSRFLYRCDAAEEAQNALPKPLLLDSTVMMKDKTPSPMSSAIQQPAMPASVDSYLLEVADAVNRTLDLNTLLQRVAEMLKRVIDYEIFAILLLNEKTQELRVRFQVGHPPEVAESWTRCYRTSRTAPRGCAGQRRGGRA